MNDVVLAMEGLERTFRKRLTIRLQNGGAGSTGQRNGRPLTAHSDDRGIDKECARRGYGLNICPRNEDSRAFPNTERIDRPNPEDLTTTVRMSSRVIARSSNAR
jgi:hypothetical protein